MNNSEDNENEQSKEENSDIIRISSNVDDEKYIIKIYSSKDHATIIFKIEIENIQTFYFYEKYDLRDFKQKNKHYFPSDNLQEVFNTLKQIVEKCSTKLEKKSLKINISFIIESETIATFTLRKKIVSQNRLNTLLVEQIQDNKSKINDLKIQAIKFDTSIQKQNDIINNINNKINTINNNITNIINDINLINNTIKNSLKKEEIKESNDEKKNISKKDNSNINKDKKGEKDQKKNNNKINENKKEKNEKKNKNEIIDNSSNDDEDNKKDYISKKIIEESINLNKKEENKTDKNNNDKYGFFNKAECNIILIIINVIILIFMIYLLYSFLILKNDFTFEKIKEEKFRKKISIFNVLDNLDDEELQSIENYYSKSKKNKIIIKDTNELKNKKKSNNELNDKKKINKQNNANDSLDYSRDNNNIKHNKKNDSNSYKINNSDQSKDIQNNNNSLLETKDINYFKEKIKLKTPYKIKDIKFALKYKSSSSNYKDFYNNCRDISENLILLKNKEGKKIGIFSKNIINIMNSINTNNFSVEESINLIGYIFGSENIDEINFKDFISIYNIFVSIYKDIFNFLNKNDLIGNDNVNTDNKENYIGNIDEMEIYQIKYIS